MQKIKYLVLSIGLICNIAAKEVQKETSEVTKKVLSEEYSQLVEKAKEARKNAYAPYSKFLVGAAVLTKSNNVYTGVNVENASYGLSVCAERNAIFKAVSELGGEVFKKEFKAIAIILDALEFGSPCGACRQVIIEFGKDVDIIMATMSGNFEIKKASELLPYAFTLDE